VTSEMKEITNAKNYVLTETGQIYNRTTCQPVQTMWNHRLRKPYSRLVNDDGVRVRVYHDRLTAETPQMDSEGLLDLPEYPDYQIAPHGAVWRLRSRKNLSPVLMRTFDKSGKQYVQLTDKAGKRKTVSIEHLLEIAK